MERGGGGGGGADQWPGVLACDCVKGADQQCWLLAVFSGGGGVTRGLAGSCVFEVCVPGGGES